jgi:xylose dehydrogenase (NAD/NADP)
VLRFGILGAARIAEQFAGAVAHSKTARTVAVASRDTGRGRDFANRFGLAFAGDYAALLADPSLDAVYIPLPNALHAPWAISACEAGKHVLCEKPLALTADEVRRMQSAARSNGVHLMEAYPYAAQPLFGSLRGLLAQGAIGSLRHIDARFGFRLGEQANIRRDAALGGGALFDVGCYVVSLCVLLAGTPSRVTAVATELAPGVDAATSVLMEYDCGLVARLGCWFDAASDRHATLIGEDGVIETDFPNHTSPDAPGVLTVRSGKVREAIIAPTVNGFLAEAESFAALVFGDTGGWTGASAEQSLAIARTLDAIRQSAREKRPVSLTD